MNQRTLMAATLSAAFVLALPLLEGPSIGGRSPLFGQETSASRTVPKTTSLARAATSELERLRAQEKRLIEIIDRAMESVVFIQGGSGFVISEDGYVLTNDHVVTGRPGGDAPEVVYVHMRRGRRLEAEVVGRDVYGDVALLKLKQPPGVPPLPFGDSDALSVGEPVIAIGDPFLVGSFELFLEGAPPDYEPAASMGIVSALHRYSDGYTDSIQVDAAVNPGNSGGPLLTLDGKVVGINGKIENPFGVGINSGIGYAIPINQVKRFLEPLRQAGGGIVRHGTISGLDVETRARGKAGLRVAKVESGSAAARHGFRKGDLILSVAGQEVKTKTRYKGVLGTYPAGDEVSVRVARGNKSLEIKVALYENDDAWLGVEPDDDEPDDEKGVKVGAALAGGPAARAGMRPADVIRRLGDSEVSNIEDLKRLLKPLKPGETIRVGVLRDGKRIEIEVKLASKRP